MLTLSEIFEAPPMYVGLILLVLAILAMGSEIGNLRRDP